MIFGKGGKIAEGEARMVIRRANDRDRQRIGRKRIAAEFLRACHFGNAVEPDR